ncbi:AraC family transcriptional regulator [Chitinophaga sancti]|uniref:AraC family transcriptional regulator n=1 Tax=Chitinophaga sancti TaxID=1004 RepID=A0A1K1MVG8_9BACT|nr:AraC family transcriptional regulator [Chitinophaga sancti]WQD63022.1 AraC family transcriptional regulator [Chitinophaga sancti]WQG91353.1 AraC family transcriptional regulator [Chitinophaga sancti]SFW27065.1 AraC-type DNA-binding protein [Chitinophaga sancti]
MKIRKEKIEIQLGHSFKLFSPSMRKNFYWHFHPEIELVYVEAVSGIRHVGRHISGYTGSDLVLIGPNVPHLNFDYGLETEYKQIVVQLKVDFLEALILPTAEFGEIRALFERSHKGLAFYGDTKEKVVKRLKEVDMEHPFEALLGLLEIFQLLGRSGEVEVLNEGDTGVKWLLNDKVRMGTIYDYVHENYDKEPDVNEIAARVHLGTAAFCRYFKRQTKMTFTDFVNQYRMSNAKNLLLQGKSAGEVCYEVGFESVSYFNRLFKRVVGVTPAVFRRGYNG